MGSKRKEGRKRKRRSAFQRLQIAVLTFILLAAVCICGVYLLTVNMGEPKKAEVTVSLDSLFSPYAVLIEADTGAVIGSRQSDERMYPASMTKILSVYVAIKEIRDLNQTVTMDADYYDALYQQDASRAGFEPGETTTVSELLYGALLPSGAECCMQLAIEAAGSEEALVDLMNKKVEKLGLTGSHFTNCTGLHDEDQYTTPSDLAKILKAALQNSTFRSVFTTHYHVMSATNLHPEGFTVWSTFFKAVEDEIVKGGRIIGAKTGYTEEAGECLASLAQIGEKEYILVTGGRCDSEDAGSYNITDAYTAYNLLGEALGFE